jgi:transposase InsO family protein
MTEDEKMQVAVFRFGVISDFVNGIWMSRAERRRLIRDKCARKWPIPFSAKTRIAKGTIRRWIRLYRDSNGDLKSLFPKDRSDQGKCRAMDEETCCALIRLRQEMPDATVNNLIATMNRRGLVAADIEPNLSTVYRFLHQQNLMNLTQHKPVDRRKFEAELPNDLWQSDVLHGPKVDIDGKMKKTYLIAIIDDHSRLITRKLYVDNGAAFRSKHLEYITASLGITLIHSKPYKPQGRGKIERFFLTVRGQFLGDFKGQTLDELNAAFNVWLNHTYHQRKHSATGQTPLSRFTSQMHCLRTSPANLKDYFRKVSRRKVNKDRTLTLNGRLFEGPIPLIGKRVELLYHESEPENVEVKYQNQSFGMIRPVDLAVNYRVKRDKNNNPQIHVDNPTTYRGGKLWSSKRRNDNE